MPARCKPGRRPGNNPPLDVQPVRTAVQGHSRLVHAGFRRHGADGGRGDIGGVGQQDGYAAPQPRRQRLEEITLMDVPASRFDVPSGAQHCGRVQVRGMQLDSAHLRQQGRPHGTGTAAKVNDKGLRKGLRNGLRGGAPPAVGRAAAVGGAAVGRSAVAGSAAEQQFRLPDEELGAAAWHKHSGGHADAKPTEVGPAKDVFQGQPGGTPFDHCVQLSGGPGSGGQQACFLLGENAACGPETADDVFRAIRRRGPAGLDGAFWRQKQAPLAAVGGFHATERGTIASNLGNLLEKVGASAYSCDLALRSCLPHHPSQQQCRYPEGFPIVFFRSSNPKNPPCSQPARGVAAAVAVLVAAAALAAPAYAAPEPKGPEAPSASHSLRAPVTDENFYFVMADRFNNGSTANDDGGLGGDPMVSGFDPTKKGFYNGGDLKGLLDKIDYIQGMGTTSIWLTPSFKNKAVQPEDKSAGYHGYWVTDFTQIDPHLGTNDELKALIDEAHSRGMKVYFDIITNHTADVVGYGKDPKDARKPYISKDTQPYKTAAGEEFDDRDYAGSDEFPKLDPGTSFPYTPVLDEAEEDLKVPSWLNDLTLYHNRGDTTFQGEDSFYGDFFGLDDLFTEHPRVVDGMADIYETWIGEFGVDGFRIDTMKHVNDEFWQEFGPRVLDYAKEQGKDEFFMFGEVFDTSKSFTSQFTTRNRMQAVLDFPFQDAARNFASRSQSASQLETFFAGDDWYTDADSNVYQLPTFLGNHDMGRIGSFIAADNPRADDAERVARDRLAHELMYFSRGNPVVYYGDEQGFTGPGGDQDARQTLFASQVPEYLDDDLLGTDATHATDNFNTAHPLYSKISELAALTAEHPALRNGAHQNRYAAETQGIYAFSRTDATDQREYVVAVNNSGTAQTAAVPTYIAKRTYTRIYGDTGDDGASAAEVKTADDGKLSVTVPPLSAVVYESSGRIPHSKAAPAVALQEPATAEGDNGRIRVAADVDGSSFYEVTFQARTAGGEWEPIGTDDTAPYQVFHEVTELNPGTAVEYRAVVLDNGGHTSVSAARNGTVPAPVLAMQKPAEGSSVDGTVEVSATASPEKAGYTVSFERSVDGGAWASIGSDSSSPAYTVFDDIAALGLADGAELRYRATMSVPGAENVVSDIRTVVAGEIPQPDSVTVAGSLNSELGCGEWDPTCAAAFMTLDPADKVWRLTLPKLPAGTYEFKAALNGGWDENYGAGGALKGANIVLEHPGGAVTFRYDHTTHLLSPVYASQQPGAVAAAGSMNAEQGCPDVWMPACDQAQLALDPDDLVWKLSVEGLKAGTYEFKAALNRSWAVSYGAGGSPNGANISLVHDGGPLTIRYDHFTHVMTAG